MMLTGHEKGSGSLKLDAEAGMVLHRRHRRHFAMFELQRINNQKT
jgi:hypothetical protein